MTSPAESATPLPCPFCGTAASIYMDSGCNSYYITCAADRCPGYAEMAEWKGVSKFEAIAAWNRRPAPQVNERKAFEAWLPRRADRLRIGNDYTSPLTSSAWSAWQARAALAGRE